MTQLTGCCIFRKAIRTETVTVVDTLIAVKHDTIHVIETVNLTDTLILQVSTGTITTYIDTTLKKIVTKFQGKIFTVPALIPTRIITITEVPKCEKKLLRFEDKFLLVLCFIMISVFLFNRKKL